MGSFYPVVSTQVILINICCSLQLQTVAFPALGQAMWIFRKILNEENKVYFTVGKHPQCCTSIQKDDLINLEKNLFSWGRVVTLGEVGIDYTGGYSPAECEAQRTALRSMLLLAVRLDLPVVVHIREVGISRLASEHCLEILRKCLPESHVIHCHCFTGGMSELNEWLFQMLCLGSLPQSFNPTAIKICGQSSTICPWAAWSWRQIPHIWYPLSCISVLITPVVYHL